MHDDTAENMSLKGDNKKKFCILDVVLFLLTVHSTDARVLHYFETTWSFNAS